MLDAICSLVVLALESGVLKSEGDAQGQASSGGVLNVMLSGGASGVAIILLLIVVSICALALVVEPPANYSSNRVNATGVCRPSSILSQEQRPGFSSSDLHGTAKLSGCSASLWSRRIISRLGSRRKRMEESLAEQSARLLRKIDYLSVIGNIAPMIGLLGTVVGMVFAFQEVADSQGAARAAELASGIYQALVSTVGGLIIAIPSLAAFAVFRNRVDQLISETGEQALAAIAPLKRTLQAGSFVESPPQISPGSHSG